jgi:hypothetical protein
VAPIFKNLRIKRDKEGITISESLRTAFEDYHLDLFPASFFDKRRMLRQDIPRLGLRFDKTVLFPMLSTSIFN